MAARGASAGVEADAAHRRDDDTTADGPEEQSGVAVFLHVRLETATYLMATYVEKPRAETEEKACSSERPKQAVR